MTADEVEPSTRSTATPPWGTPNPADAAPGSSGSWAAGGDAEGRYQVLIEESVGSSDSTRWAIDVVPDQIWGSRRVGRLAAEQTAREFRPRHPMRQQRRTVYRVTPDEYLVIIEGLTKTFHFRVTVAELLD